MKSTISCKKFNHAHTGREKISIYYIIPDYTVAVGLVPILPSIASFFFRQFVHKKGPSHGFEEGEKKGPELTDKPSPGG